MLHHHRSSNLSRSAARLAHYPLLESLEARRLLSVGELDMFFADGGILSVPTPEFTQVEATRSVLALPDGTIYLAGSANLGSPSTSLVLARVTFDGQPDPTFGTNGIVFQNLDAVTDEKAVAMVMQADDKLVILGSGDTTPGNTDFVLSRFHLDGSLDTSFGTNGVTTVDFGAMRNDQPYELLLQPDGKLVAIGDSENGNKSRGAIARFSADGLLDTGFATNGKLVLDLSPEFGGIGGRFTAGLALSDGSLLALGGAYYDYNWGENKLVTVRLLPNGSLDSTFGTGGQTRQVIDLMSPDDVVEAPDGGYLVNAMSASSWGVIRLGTDGLLDTSWGADGIAQIYTDGSSNVRDGGALVIQPDQSILASHHYFGGWTWGRVLPDGQIDMSAGTGGLVQRQLGTYGEGGNALALQPDGRALIVGSRPGHSSGISPGLVVARYRTMPDPSPGAYLDAGTRIVTIVGDDSDNDLAINMNSMDTLSVTLDGTTQLFSTAEMNRIDVRLLGGNDAFALDGNLPGGMIDLSGGNDSLSGTGLTAGSVRKIFGREGDDLIELVAGAGASVQVDGGADNDTFVLIGTEGDDAVVFSRNTVAGAGYTAAYAATENVLASLLGGEDSATVPATLPVPTTVNGGDNDDEFVLLPPERNMFGVVEGTTPTAVGGADADLLRYTGTSGNDAISVHPGHFRVVGDAGTYLSEVEQVLFEGVAGNDRAELVGNVGTNVHFDGGPDTGSGNLDRLSFVGTSGNDQVQVFPDQVLAGGHEHTFANLERVTVEGSGGNDEIESFALGTLVAFTLSGGLGNDRLFVSGGGQSGLPSESPAYVTISGDAGDDLFEIPPEFSDGSSAVSIAGGTGTDTLRFSGNIGHDTFAVSSMSITHGVALAAYDSTVDNIDLHGTSESETFSVNSVGTSTRLSIFAGDGDDVFDYSPTIAGPASILNGDEGADQLLFGAANLRATIFDGGTGADSIQYALALNGSLETTFRLGSSAMGDTRTLSDSNVEAVTVTGTSGADTFFVTPRASATITVEGGEPSTVPGDTLNLAFAAVTDPEFTSGAAGAGSYEFGNRQPLTYMGMESVNVDNVSPAVYAVTINYGAAQRSNLSSISLQFSEPVNIASLIANGTISQYVQIVNQSAPNLPLNLPGSSRYQWDSNTNTLAVDLTTDGFGGSSSTMLANGRYELRLSTSSITDSTGNPLADTDSIVNGTLVIDRSTGAALQNLFRLSGDLDGDADVDLSDLSTLAAVYGTANSLGDVDGDGDVDLNDLSLLSAHYGTSLPPIAPGEAQAVATIPAAIIPNTPVAPTPVVPAPSLTTFTTQFQATNRNRVFKRSQLSLESGQLNTSKKWKVQVDWGDGATSISRIIFNAKTKRWEISEDHRYKKSGTYTVKVTVIQTTSAYAASLQ